MRPSTLFAAAAGLLASSVLASDVLELHKDDFHGIVSPEDLMLVEFFARELRRQAVLWNIMLTSMCVRLLSLVSFPAFEGARFMPRLPESTILFSRCFRAVLTWLLPTLDRIQVRTLQGELSCMHRPGFPLQKLINRLELHPIGTCPSIRRGRYRPQEPEHQARKGRLHRRAGAVLLLRCQR